MEYSKLKRKDNMIIFFDLDGTLLDHKSSEYLGVKEFYNYNREYFEFSENEFYKVWCDISEKYFNIYLAGKLTFREQRIDMKGILIDRNELAVKIAGITVINSLENLKNYIEG